MCGIVGFITGEKLLGAHRRASYVQQGLIADTLRGEDSTGAYFVEHGNQLNTGIGWCRDVVDGYTFVANNTFWHKYLGKGEQHAIIGHNRSATIGGIHMGAAHPFQEGPITLVHNGTLTQTGTLLKSQAMLKAANDSHAICYNLGEEGIETMAAKLDGAFTLIWHDARDNTMNIVRNEKRPIHLAKVEDEKTLLIGSEADMIYWLAKRNNMKIEEMATPAPGQWLRFQHGSIIPEIKEVDLYEDDWEYYGGYATKRYPTHGTNLTPKATPISKYKAPPPTNQVVVCGRKRDIPDPLQDMLLDAGIVVEDRFVFTPCRKVPQGEKSIVSGYLDTFNAMTAIASGVPNKLLEHGAFDRRWVVRPIGIKVLDETETAVICRLCCTDAQSPRGNELLEHMRMPPPWEDDKPTPKKEAEWQPSDEITQFGYMSAIQGGCIQCGIALDLDEEDDFVWVNQGHDPLCPSCGEELLEGFKENDNAH